MIVSAVFGILAFFLNAIASVLPSTTFLVSPTVPAYFLGGSGVVSFLNKFMPVSEMLTALRYMIDYYFPAVLAYKFANWIYRHLPAIGGG